MTLVVQAGVVEDGREGDSDLDVAAELRSWARDGDVVLVEQDDPDLADANSPELVEVVHLVALEQVDLGPAVVTQNLKENYFEKREHGFECLPTRVTL